MADPRCGERVRRLSIRISDSVFVGCYVGLIYIVIMILCGCKRIFIISAVCATSIGGKGGTNRDIRFSHSLPLMLFTACIVAKN